MGKPVEAWVRQLGSWLPWRRRAAAEALGRAGDPRAVEPLMRSLRHWNKGVRCAAAQALGALGDPRAAIPMAPLLADLDPRVRRIAAVALAGTRSVGEAVELLDKVAADVTEAAPRYDPTGSRTGPVSSRSSDSSMPMLHALGSLPPRSRRAALQSFEAAFRPVADRLLSQGTPPGKAIQVVGDVGGERAIPPLVALFGRSDRQRYPDALQYARAALRRLGPGRETVVARAALEHLVGIDARASLANLGRLLSFDPNYQIRSSEVRGLLLASGAAGVSGLLHAVTVGEARERRAVAGTLLAFEPGDLASAALQELQGGRAAPTLALRAACDEEPLIWRRAVNEWRRCFCMRASLVELLSSPHLWVKLWAAEALGGYPRREDLDDAPGRFQELLGSADENERLAAAVGLSWYSEPGALPPLVRALGATERETRLAAALALGRTGVPAAPALPRLQVLLDVEAHPDAKRIYREVIDRIEEALQGAPAELVAASAPAGLGYELEAAGAPAGTGTELVSDARAAPGEAEGARDEP